MVFRVGNMKATGDLAKNNVGRVGFRLDLAKNCIFTFEILAPFLTGS